MDKLIATTYYGGVSSEALTIKLVVYFDQAILLGVLYSIIIGVIRLWNVSLVGKQPVRAVVVVLSRVDQHLLRGLMQITRHGRTYNELRTSPDN